MMKRLEGRSLAHPGCLIGITTGLIVGIILAGILAIAFNITLNILLLFWLIVTVGLGIVGWVIGERLSKRFTLVKEETAETTSPESSLANSRDNEN
ncbi:MAG: DUF2207 domain-containing protein [Chloroflexi bacterium]|nr:MAG: DUF2207 domain-containing protein [Chloroflexota bacterium]